MRLLAAAFYYSKPPANGTPDGLPQNPENGKVRTPKGADLPQVAFYPPHLRAVQEFSDCRLAMLSRLNLHLKRGLAPFFLMVKKHAMALRAANGIMK